MNTGYTQFYHELGQVLKMKHNMKPLKLPGFDLPEIGKFMIESQEPIDLARSSNYIELTILQAHFSHETSARSIYKNTFLQLENYVCNIRRCIELNNRKGTVL